MSTTNITGFEIGPILVNSSGNTYNIRENATLIIGGDIGGGGGGVLATIQENIDNPLLNHHNTYNIDGRVIGYEVAMFTAGANNKINIGENGEISGKHGIAVAGKNSVVTNDGEIIASVQGYGIYGYKTTGTEITNNGEISGHFGIYYEGDKGLIVNGKDGFITGDAVGIAALSDAPGTARIVNHGMVVSSGDGMAFASSMLDITLVNDGTLKGNVMFGDGDDRFDNRGGKVDGTIAGGLGDDVLIVDNAKYKLTEIAAEGDDTVQSTVTYKLSDHVEKLVLIGKANINGTGTAGDDLLHGNAGNNVLKGLGGMDTLSGHKGNDKLYGGADADTFFFATGDGHDKVMDFTQMSDRIDVSDWAGMDNFADVKSHAKNQGDDVLIESGADSVLIIGLHKGDLVNTDFGFAV